MRPGDRIRINDQSPWVSRVGCVGYVATPPAGYSDRYPVAGLGRDEVLVELVDDPHNTDRWWSCVMPTTAVEART